MGGIVELAPGYLPPVYSSIKKAGGLCIADEVQAGFARTGSHFWSFEAQGVTPDIVTMAKVYFHFFSFLSFLSKLQNSCVPRIALWHDNIIGVYIIFENFLGFDTFDLVRKLIIFHMAYYY